MFDPDDGHAGLAQPLDRSRAAPRPRRRSGRRRSHRGAARRDRPPGPWPARAACDGATRATSLGDSRAAEGRLSSRTSRQRSFAAAPRSPPPAVAPTYTFSKTVIPVNGRGTWCVRPMPMRQRSADARPGDVGAAKRRPSRRSAPGPRPGRRAASSCRRRSVRRCRRTDPPPPRTRPRRGRGAARTTCGSSGRRGAAPRSTEAGWSPGPGDPRSGTG